MNVYCRKNSVRLAALFLAVLFAVGFVVPALADEGDAYANTGVAGDVTHTAELAENTDPAQSEDNTETPKNKWYYQWGLDEEENQINIDPVTTDQVANWVEKKGNEVIYIVQLVARIITVIWFFISIIFIVIGAIGNHRTMTGGFISLFISACAYVAITYGKELLNLFSSWVMS